jgi:hypothetical protein
LPPELAIVTPPSEEWKATIHEMNASFEGLDLEARPSVRPEWNKWAAAAGLDEWEMRVFRCRLTGVSREQAMGLLPDEASRKAMQAAWRRFDRNGMDWLREAAKIKLEKSVPEGRIFDTSK